ncbi:MAG: type II CAAX endopeptidase family protein [Pseudomonadota bacterium]
MPGKRIVAEVLVVCAISTAVLVALWHLAGISSWIADNLGSLVALVFILLPALVARRRGEDLADHGLTLKPLGRSLAFGLGGPALVFPLFLVGFVLFYQLVCASSQGQLLSSLAPHGMCQRFLGWTGLVQPHAPADFLQSLLVQLGVVALPEELFFRGYVLGRLEQAMPPSRRWLGGGIGIALFFSAALFAAGHLLVDLDPRRLAVFFPGLLFGWMRSATKSILAGTLAHACSNLYIEALHRTFFR